MHYFKHFIKIMKRRGHNFFVTARNKECAFELLKKYNISYQSRGNGGFSFLGKFAYMLKADYYIFSKSINFRPNLFFSFGSTYAAHASKLLGKPHIAFDDTEHAKLEHIMYVPFTDIILTPSCFRKNLGSKQISFNGYMELCYLHPKRFVPDESVLKLLSINPREQYVILRFVSWGATHDYGHSGLTHHMKRRAVTEFSKYARVFISSEQELPDDLIQYQIDIPPEMIHSALWYASLLYGESATMSSECAVLGTPAIYIDDEGRGYTEEEENKFGLVFNYTESIRDQELSIDKGVELLKTPNIKKTWQEKAKEMLLNKIDVTAFMVWFIENYPNSRKIMREDPGFQFNFC